MLQKLRDFSFGYRGYKPQVQTAFSHCLDSFKLQAFHCHKKEDQLKEDYFVIRK